MSILIEGSKLMDKLRDSINNYNSLLTQGRYCPADALESARLKVANAAEIYADYAREHGFQHR